MQPDEHLRAARIRGKSVSVLSSSTTSPPTSSLVILQSCWHNERHIFYFAWWIPLSTDQNMAGRETAHEGDVYVPDLHHRQPR